MLCKRKWFLAAMFTGGALALAGCDDSGISQNTLNSANTKASEEKTRADDAENKLGAAQEEAQKAKDDVARLRNDLIKAENDLFDALDSAETGAENVGKLTAEVERLKLALDAATKALEEKPTADNAAAATLKTINNLKAQVNDLFDALDLAETGAENVGKLTAEVERLKLALDAATKALEEKPTADNAAAATLKTINNLKAQVNDLFDALDLAETGAENVGKLTAEVERLKLALDAATKALEEKPAADNAAAATLKTINNLKAQVNDLFDALDLAETGAENVGKLTAEVERLKLALDAATKALEEKPAADNAAAATLKTINNLKAQVNDLFDALDLAETGAENVGKLTAEVERLKLALDAATKALTAAQNAAKMVRFGSITADPGEVLDAIVPSGSGATVPITLKKVGEKGQLKLGAFGKDLDETELHLPGIDGFVGTEFERELKADDDGGTTKIRAVAWSDVKTLSKLGDAPMYSGGAMATAGLWNWIKVDQNLKREPGEGESQYVVKQGTQVVGIYDGVPGVYTCEPEKQAEYCSGGGDATRFGVIKFTPKVDYLSFGAWMSKPNAEGDQPSSPVVGVFAMGGPAFDFSDQTNKNPETATYTGGATGFYAKRKVGTDADASAGSYTADVYLWADFESEVKVSGEVTNFQDMRNGMHLKWVVDLDDTVYDIETSSGPFKGDTSFTVNDVQEKQSGDWEVKFYGENAPSSAAGTFNAKTGTLKMEKPKDKGFLGIVGAFGAKKVMPPPAP